MTNPRLNHVSIPPLPWRPIGQVRTASTAPMIGGPRGPGQCAAPRVAGQRGVSWQRYNPVCSSGVGGMKM